jgi:hypothetical protein
VIDLMGKARPAWVALDLGSTTVLDEGTAEKGGIMVIPLLAYENVL